MIIAPGNTGTKPLQKRNGFGKWVPFSEAATDFPRNCPEAADNLDGIIKVEFFTSYLPFPRDFSNSAAFK